MLKTLLELTQEVESGCVVYPNIDASTVVCKDKKGLVVCMYTAPEERQMSFFSDENVTTLAALITFIQPVTELYTLTTQRVWKVLEPLEKPKADRSYLTLIK